MELPSPKIVVNLPRIIRSFTAKKNHIGPANNEILKNLSILYQNRGFRTLDWPVGGVGLGEGYIFSRGDISWEADGDTFPQKPSKDLLISYIVSY